MEKPPQDKNLENKLDSLCPWSLCECGHELPNSQLDDLVLVLVIFERNCQPLHVKIDLHVLKLRRDKVKAEENVISVRS